MVTRGYNGLEGFRGDAKGLQWVTRGYSWLEGLKRGYRRFKGVKVGYKRVITGYKRLQVVTRGYTG